MKQHLPEVRGISHGAAGELTLALYIPATLAHFSGHFPGLPILPGVVQIDWAVHFAQQHLPLSGKFSKMENLKFQSIVTPDSSLNLSLKWDAVRGRLEFSYTGEQAGAPCTYSSARLVFAEAAA